MINALRAHERSGLQKGVCLDAVSGGLRLSSSSTNTWPSKVALALVVVEWLEGKPIEQVCPSAMDALAAWMQTWQPKSPCLIRFRQTRAASLAGRITRAA